MAKDINQRLRQLYQKANTYSDDLPNDLAKKIIVYTEILRILGLFVADSTDRLGKVKADRKKEYSMVLAREEGTQKEKEGKAELRTHHLRKSEYNLEAEVIKWKYAYESTLEKVNAQKKLLEVLLIEWGGKGNGV